MAMRIISVSDVKGFRLGNAENKEKGTGCTVIICEKGAVGGVDVRGGGPATRETDLLRSENTVNSVNAVVLSGGSAFGLEAASGVMRELADKKIGFNAGDNIIVPIVCGASLYDLPVGDPKAFPDVHMGIQAVRNAYEGSFAKGNHGAGTGATVGKLKGYDRAMKTGLGAFACGDGIIEVGAVAAVNAVGDIYNGAGNIIAGLRSEDGETIYGTIKTLKSMVHDGIRLMDDTTSFINRSELEEALAAAAKQYKKETVIEPAVNTAEEPAEESIAEPVEEEPAIVILEEPSVEEPVEDAAEAAEEEPEATDIYDVQEEEPAEEVFIAEAAVTEPEISEYPEEETVELIEETAAEDQAEELIEEPAEEPVEETPEELTEDRFRYYDEISIPAAPAEAVEETVMAAPEEEAEALEPAEEIQEAESADEPEDEETEEPAAEFPEEPVLDEPVEEPAALTREDMGYDIVFNTTISCLITNALLTKSQANKLASILHDAYARAIKPVHGTLDGDTVFVLATGKQPVNFDAFAALATDVMQYAIIDGAMSAESAYGIPAARDMQKTGE